jgi:hypothetical protein
MYVPSHIIHTATPPSKKILRLSQNTPNRNETKYAMDFDRIAKRYINEDESDDGSKTSTKQIGKLTTVQRLAVKTILGCYRTTSTAAMEIETGLQPAWSDSKPRPSLQPHECSRSLRDIQYTNG